MDIVNELTEAHLAYWADRAAYVAPVLFGCPDGMTNCTDAQALVTAPTPDGPNVVRVAWKPNEIDLANLARGGTIWLSTWGSLPPHDLEVQAP